jgi:hypothetical protein
MATWDSLPLCTPDDVSEEIRNVDSLLSVRTQHSGVEDGELLAAIAWVKQYKMRPKLLNEARRIFERSFPPSWLSYDRWLLGEGTTPTDIDSILDKLDNPEELKPLAVIYVIEKLYAFGETTPRMNGYGDGYRDRLGGWIERQKIERWNDCIPLLRFDLDSDGEIQNHERVPQGFRFWRG